MCRLSFLFQCHVCYVCKSFFFPVLPNRLWAGVDLELLGETSDTESFCDLLTRACHDEQADEVKTARFRV